MALEDIQALVADLVRDEVGRLATAERDRAITAAVARYGKDRPRRLVEDVTGGGDSLPLPESWTAESELLGAEYPIGEMPPSPLSCTLYTTPTEQVFRLGDALPAGAQVRLTFTVPHALSISEDTILPSHREAVAAWAASLLLGQLAAAAINDGESTIPADATTRRSKAQEYARRSSDLKTFYFEAMGIAGQDGGSGAGQAASGAVVSWGRRERLAPRKRLV